MRAVQTYQRFTSTSYALELLQEQRSDSGEHGEAVGTPAADLLALERTRPGRAGDASDARCVGCKVSFPVPKKAPEVRGCFSRSSGSVYTNMDSASRACAPTTEEEERSGHCGSVDAVWDRRRMRLRIA